VVRGLLLLLLSVASCARSAQSPSEFRQSCGGVPLEHASSRVCPSPTVERDGSCTLVASELSGECATGYRVELASADTTPGEPWCVTAPAPASSNVASPKEVERAAAKELFRRAHAACEAGEYDAAVDQLRRALDLYPHPALWAELGKCEERLGHVTRALSAWRACLVVEPPSAASDSERKQSALHELRTQASSRIAELETRVARLRLDIPPDLELPRVALNRALYPSALLAAGITLDPGDIELAVTARGRRPWLARIRLASGEDRRVEPALDVEHGLPVSAARD